MSNTTPTAYTHIAVFGAREGVKRSKTMTKFLKVREGRDVAGVIESHIDVDLVLDGGASAIYTIAGEPEYHAATAETSEND